MTPRVPSEAHLLNDLVRETGRMSEALERGKEDRAEMRESFARLAESMEALRTGLNAMNQTLQSTSREVSSIGTEKLVERVGRLDAILDSDDARSVMPRILALDGRMKAAEDQLSTWKQWAGQGWSFFGKCVLALLASGLIGGGIATTVAQHFHP